MNFLFGTNKSEESDKQITSDELNKNTASEVDKIKARTALIEAQTKLAKAESRYERVKATMPKSNTGLTGMLGNKTTWIIIVGIIFVIIVIKAVT